MSTGRQRSFWILPIQFCGTLLVFIALVLPCGYWWHRAFRENVREIAMSVILSKPVNIHIQEMRPAMIRLPTGRFWMGCSSGESICRTDEELPHEVEISIPFSISETEVTQSQFFAVMGYNPSRSRTAVNWRELPVENVEWTEVKAYCYKLSQAEGLPICDDVRCSAYRLPSEAEWEFSALAGESTPYAGGSASSTVAWYAETVPDKSPQPVRTKRPNQWGLYDMSGNVWEWAVGSEPTYGIYFRKDPVMREWHKVLRGGAWDSPASELRTKGRRYGVSSEKAPNVGFRIARSLFDSPQK